MKADQRRPSHRGAILALAVALVQLSACAPLGQSMSDDFVRETRERQLPLLGVAAGAAFGSALIGGVVGGATSTALCRDTVLSECGAFGVVTGSLVLVTASVPPLVTLLGSGLRGRGDLLGAYLGMFVGLIPAAVLFAIAPAVDDRGSSLPLYITGYIAAINGAWAGAVGGYEVSDQEARGSDAALDVRPSVLIEPHGLTIRFEGAF